MDRLASMELPGLAAGAAGEIELFEIRRAGADVMAVLRAPPLVA